MGRTVIDDEITDTPSDADSALDQVEREQEAARGPRWPRVLGGSIAAAVLAGSIWFGVTQTGDSGSDNKDKPAAAERSEPTDAPAAIPELTIEEMLGVVGLTDESIAQQLEAFKTDPAGDFTYSVPNVTPGDPAPDVDITRFGVISLSLSEERAQALAEALPCDTSTGTHAVFCPEPDGKPLAEGEYLFSFSQWAAPPAAAEQATNYIFSFVYDQDYDTADNYVATAPFTQDFYANTDTWHEIKGAPGSWTLESSQVVDGTPQPTDPAVWAFLEHGVRNPYVVWLSPADQLDDKSGVRFTAFRHDGSYEPEKSAGDVSTPNGQPLLLSTIFELRPNFEPLYY